jgi:putative hemolysin
MASHSVLFWVLVGLLILSAFFSASETSLIALNRVRIRHMMEKKKRGARRVYGLLSQMDRLIATLLIGNNLVNTAIASIATVILTGYFSEQKAILVGTVLITFIIVIFGELTPKIFATNHPEGVAFMVRHLVSLFITVCGPITKILTWVSNGIIRLFGGNPHHRSPLVTEEELKMMITIGREQGFYGDSERKMLEKIFHFDEIIVNDVMTPLEKMTSVSLDIQQEELERVLMEEGHSRIPVYDTRKDNIVGILHVRDLIYLIKNNSLIRLGDIINAPYEVLPNKKVNELMKEFQSKKKKIAIVKDEKSKKAIGLVTLEDLLEEIVGEIEETEELRK